MGGFRRIKIFNHRSGRERSSRGFDTISHKVPEGEHKVPEGESTSSVHALEGAALPLPEFQSLTKKARIECTYHITIKLPDSCVFNLPLFQVDLFSEDWLRQSSWEPSHETILLIHGYAGGDDTLPIVVLRDGRYSYIVIAVFKVELVY